MQLCLPLCHIQKQIKNQNQKCFYQKNLYTGHETVSVKLYNISIDDYIWVLCKLLHNKHYLILLKYEFLFSSYFNKNLIKFDLFDVLKKEQFYFFFIFYTFHLYSLWRSELIKLPLNSFSKFFSQCISNFFHFSLKILMKYGCLLYRHKNVIKFMLSAILLASSQVWFFIIC